MPSDGSLFTWTCPSSRLRPRRTGGTPSPPPARAARPPFRGGAASVTPSPKTTLPARVIVPANTTSSCLLARCTAREDEVEHDDCGPAGERPSTSRPSGRGSTATGRPSLDRLAVDADDHHACRRGRAGEEGVRGAALKPARTPAREPDPRGPGDHHGEEEHRHYVSDQHTSLHGATLEQPNRARLGRHDVGSFRSRPSRDVAEHRGDGRIGTAVRLTATVHVRRDPVQRPRQPTNRAPGPGCAPITACAPGIRSNWHSPTQGVSSRRTISSGTSRRVATRDRGSERRGDGGPTAHHRGVARAAAHRNRRRPTTAVESRRVRWR